MSPERSALAPTLITAFENDVTVLTPSRRNAHWLQQAFAKHALAQGRLVWPTPRAMAFDTFVLQTWRALARDTRRVLDQEQSRLLWERVVERSSLAESLLSPLAAANGSFLAWQRCIAWRLAEPGDLDDALQAYVNAGNIEAQALVDWSAEFLAICSQRNWLPIAMLPQRLLHVDQDELGVVLPEQMATLASHELTPLEQALLQRFVECGALVSKIADSAVPNNCLLATCDSEEHELQCAATWASEQLALGCQSVGIVTELSSRMPQVQRVMAEMLTPGSSVLAIESSGNSAGDSLSQIYSLAGYRRLNEFPLATAAIDVLRLAAGRAESTLVGMVLRSPFVAGAQQEASARALADARLRSRTREHYDLSAVERLCNDADCTLLTNGLRQLQTLRMSYVARALPSIWVEHFIALWRAIGWPGEAVLDSDEQQTLARLQTSVGEFGALDELLGPLSFSTAVRQFEQWAAAIRFEPRRLPTPITVVDAQALQGLRFDAVWITGLTETRWPPAATPDPFIPFELQAKARMPFATASETHRQARQRLQLLQGLADAVVLSYARQEQDAGVAASAWARDLPALKPQRAATFGEMVFAARPSIEVLEEIAAPMASGRMRGGARLFELQSQCPFRAFAEIRLRATPLDQVVPNIDVAERGMLIHAVLAQVWDQLRDSKQLQRRSNEQLTEQVRAALVFHSAKLLEGASPHRIRLLQIEQQLALTRVMQMLMLDRQRAPFHVVGRPETATQFSIDRLSVELRLDRVDELFDDQFDELIDTNESESEGARVIVDYKSGSNVSTRSWWNARPEQPQLPLYATAQPQRLVAVAFATVSAKSVAYQGVARDDGILPGVMSFDGRQLVSNDHNATQSEWQRLLDHWRVVIERLAKQFSDGDAQVDPLPNACRYCHLATLCRVNDLDVAIEDESIESELQS